MIHSTTNSPIKNLKVWQESIALVKMIYQLTNQLPKTEVYALSSQMRRAAISIPSNLAEGRQKYSQKDFLRFINIAQGSCAELDTQLIICHELYHLDIKQQLEQNSTIGKMLSGLYNSLLTTKNQKLTANNQELRTNN